MLNKRQRRRRGNQEWTIQRNWQHWVHKTFILFTNAQIIIFRSAIAIEGSKKIHFPFLDQLLTLSTWSKKILSVSKIWSCQQSPDLS